MSKTRFHLPVSHIPVTHPPYRQARRSQGRLTPRWLAEGMHLPAGAGAALTERFEKRFPIRIILEDGFAAVAAIHHMIDGPLILEPKLASHADRVGIKAFCVNSENRHLLRFFAQCVRF